VSTGDPSMEIKLTEQTKTTTITPFYERFSILGI